MKLSYNLVRFEAINKMNRVLNFEGEVMKMSVYAEKNRKTKKLIQDSFMKILEKKAFESITIANITEYAKINRGTFYLHYQDKYDLLDQIENQLFEDIGNHIDELQQHYSAGNFEGQQEYLAAALFSSIEMQAPLLKIFLGDRGRAGFHLRFRNAFTEKVRFNLEKNPLYSERSNMPFEYFLSFITSAFLGLIEQWVQNGLDKTPEEMTDLYQRIIAFIQNNSK